MFQIKPYNVSAYTNHNTKYSSSELNNILNFNDTGPERTGTASLVSEFVFDYFLPIWLSTVFPFNLINKEQYTSIPYIYDFNVRFLVGSNVTKIVIVYTNENDVEVVLRNTITVSTTSSTERFYLKFKINSFVKKIKVRIESKTLEPSITMLGLKTEGVYDSRIRFKKNGVIYSLARYAINYSGGGLKYKDANGVIRDLILVSPGDVKASPIRIKKGSTIFSIAKI